MLTAPALRYAAAVLALYLVAAAPAFAQDQEAPTAKSYEQLQAEQAARTATTAVGEVGQRQTREDDPTNVAPLGRINSRVENRVQNRLRNRIDRYYDPLANAASPFEVAGDRARTAGRRAPPPR